jgi:hypothetical protein
MMSPQSTKDCRKSFVGPLRWLVERHGGQDPVELPMSPQVRHNQAVAGQILLGQPSPPSTMATKPMQSEHRPAIGRTELTNMQGWSHPSMMSSETR